MSPVSLTFKTTHPQPDHFYRLRRFLPSHHRLPLDCGNSLLLSYESLARILHTVARVIFSKSQLYHVSSLPNTVTRLLVAPGHTHTGLLSLPGTYRVCAALRILHLPFPSLGPSSLRSLHSQLLGTIHVSVQTFPPGEALSDLPKSPLSVSFYCNHLFYYLQLMLK